MLYDTEWEVLPTDIQKAIMHLINQKQNVSGISLGPFGYGINRDTFKIVSHFHKSSSRLSIDRDWHTFDMIFFLKQLFQCTNKVYAFLMFLKDFFQWNSIIYFNVFDLTKKKPQQQFMFDY